MIIPLLPTFWCGLVRQASSLTTDDEQNQCWQGRNDLQARYSSCVPPLLMIVCTYAAESACTPGVIAQVNGSYSLQKCIGGAPRGDSRRSGVRTLHNVIMLFMHPSFIIPPLLQQNSRQTLQHAQNDIDGGGYCGYISITGTRPCNKTSP